MGNEGTFFELQLKIVDLYMEGLINNDEVVQLITLNRFVNIPKKKKYSVDRDHKIIKPFPTWNEAKFWKKSQDRLEEKRMTG